MSRLGIIHSWNVAVDLLEVGLPLHFVAGAVGVISEKKLKPVRDEVWGPPVGGSCPTSLDRQMRGHRRRLEASLFLRIYVKFGGSRSVEVDPDIFVAAIQKYWELRNMHCLDGVDIIDARAAWLFARGLWSNEMIERECPSCKTTYYHFARSTKSDTCPVCGVEQDWRMQHPSRDVDRIGVEAEQAVDLCG